MEETEISTPVETPAEDTSPETAPIEDTAETEPEAVEAAETETQDEPPLIAGKYKTQDELVKAYKELESKIPRIAEIEKRLEEAQKEQEARIQAETKERLESIRAKGFNSIEEAEAAEKIQVAEFEFYANKITGLEPEIMNDVHTLLQNYRNTGNKAYLNEAKKYFSDDVIEQCAIVKENLRSNLISEYNAQKLQQTQKAQLEFLSQVEENNKDFLADIETNNAKSVAFTAMFKGGLLQSQEDIDIFKNIYNSIYELGRASVQTEAKNKVETDEAIQKMQTAIDGQAVSISDDKLPSYAQIQKMSQDEYNTAYRKWGSKLLSAK